MPMTFVWSKPRYDSEDINETGLRFTDVLFGFALREVVVRLVLWTKLTNAARLHLVLAAITILSSYIGFRNSQKRGRFVLRFFSLATIRFGLDQAMVFLYFWLALYFATDKILSSGQIQVPHARALLTFDSRVIFAIFCLYLAWDLISHWMEHTKKYFTGKDPDVPLVAVRHRTVVTLGGLAASGVVLHVSEYARPHDAASTWWLVVLVAVVVVYRLLKDGIEPKAKPI